MSLFSINRFITFDYLYAFIRERLGGELLNPNRIYLGSESFFILLLVICALLIQVGFSLRAKTPKEKKTISLQVDYYRQSKGYWKLKNKYHTALTWIINNASSGLKNGKFNVLAENTFNKDKSEKCNIFPHASNGSIKVIFQEKQYKVQFLSQPTEKGSFGKQRTVPPSILVIPKEETTISNCEKFLEEVASEYLEHVKSNKDLYIWELRKNGSWCRLTSLRKNLGLQSIALKKTQEVELQQDLNNFFAEKDFYTQLGLPYKRGYLFYGKAGTGKTGLAYAIASEFNRSLYYFNLQEMDDDVKLRSAFAQIPKGSVVVFDKIDTMAPALLKREKLPKKLEDLKEMLCLGSFTLSCFLDCLDGYTMQPGTIVIFTANNLDNLDSAMFRAGRIDFRIELDHTDTYQLKRMYDVIVNQQQQQGQDKQVLNEEWMKEKFVEGVLPPSDVIQLFLLHRLHPEKIPCYLEWLLKLYSTEQ